MIVVEATRPVMTAVLRLSREVNHERLERTLHWKAFFHNFRFLVMSELIAICIHFLRFFQSVRIAAVQTMQISICARFLSLLDSFDPKISTRFVISFSDGLNTASQMKPQDGRDLLSKIYADQLAS